MGAVEAGPYLYALAATSGLMVPEWSYLLGLGKRAERNFQKAKAVGFYIRRLQPASSSVVTANEITLSIRLRWILSESKTISRALPGCVFNGRQCDTLECIACELETLSNFCDGGRDVLAKQKAEKPTRRSVAFMMKGKSAPPRAHYPVCLAGENGPAIGEVTSGTQSPSLNVGIGLGLVAIEHAKVGTQIEVEIRRRRFPAEIVKKPIYQRATS